MKILLTGGGTAGHVNPAIAIAQIIKENNKDAEIAFVGTSRGIENKLVTNAGFPIYHTKIMGLSRSISPKNVYALWLALYSPLKARTLVRKFKPDLIVGTGGYVCWPILKAGSSLGVKTALHESNVVPGVAVKMLQGSVDKILLNFEESKKELKYPEKAITVGNPMRVGFKLGNREKTRKELGLNDEDKLILSFGGSLGATEVNNSCIEMMANYSNKNENVFHIHATGEKNYEECKAKFDSLIPTPSDNIKMEKYIDNMPELMSACDVVIARAGAVTLSEIALMGKASILIPSPNVTNNHQYKNAKALSDKDATLLLQEKELTCETLTESVKSILEDKKRKERLEENVKSFAVSDANKRVYEELIKLIKE